MPSLTQTIKDIKNIKIQGASNICRASLTAWQTHLTGVKVKSISDYIKEAHKTAGKLMTVRPDEPLMVNAFKILLSKVVEAAKIKANKPDVANLKKLSKQAVTDFLMELKGCEQTITENGAKLIKQNENIFTHCHSGTVINILAAAKKQGKKIHVFNDETRPLMQGRITAKELGGLGIKNTMVVDGAAAFIVSNISGDEIKINRVILGFDVILPDGSAYNKIGSFGIALAAYTSGIPVYLAGTLLKKTNQKLKIELRAAHEIWANKPRGLNIINYAFCHIPAKFISGYVTEAGVLKPKEVISLSMKLKF
jgi:eIF-2B alpha/beta/delta-like uncharacterized protein